MKVVADTACFVDCPCDRFFDRYLEMGTESAVNEVSFTPCGPTAPLKVCNRYFKPN